MLQIKLFTVNPIQENTYVVSDETKEAVIIDCGCFTEREWKTVKDYIEDQHLRPVHLLNTHLHFDHCLGNRFAVRDYHLLAEAAMADYDLYSGMQAQAAMFMGNDYASHIDTDFTAQLAPALKEGDAIHFGSHTLTVIATPGHTPGGICFYCQAENVLFSGDSLFSGSIGRTDLPGGSFRDLITSISSKLLSLQPIKQRYGIVGNSGGLNRALDIAIQVAPTDLSVLIEGENGVGKEAIPRIIHDNSSRKHQKYFAINCGSIPEGTIDSELFGHEKGAFTGAIGEHEGYFGAANKGTLFLDEVGELPLSTQVRLLRVLETGEYLRVGSNEVRKTDVRIIAATNVKMKKAISEGRFREDLYFRLATIPISVPPLRDRGDDIVLLFRKFARDIAEKYRLEPIYLTEDAKQLLMLYKWPGNIRQLKNLTEQLSIISPQREITVEMLKEAGITDDSDAQGGLVLLRDTKTSQHTYENEREMLLQQLFNLSKEIQELKEMVNKSNNFNAQAANYNPQIPNIKQQPTNYNPVPSITDDAEIVNAEEYVEEQPMSIKDIHYQSILDALKRNHFNRKKAAQELGISERTIYRKLKENGYKKE